MLNRPEDSTDQPNEKRIHAMPKNTIATTKSAGRNVSVSRPATPFAVTITMATSDAAKPTPRRPRDPPGRVDESLMRER